MSKTPSSDYLERLTEASLQGAALPAPADEDERRDRQRFEATSALFDELRASATLDDRWMGDVWRRIDADAADEAAADLADAADPAAAAAADLTAAADPAAADLTAAADPAAAAAADLDAPADPADPAAPAPLHGPASAANQDRASDARSGARRPAVGEGDNLINARDRFGPRVFFTLVAAAAAVLLVIFVGLPSADRERAPTSYDKAPSSPSVRAPAPPGSDDEMARLTETAVSGEATTAEGVEADEAPPREEAPALEQHVAPPASAAAPSPDPSAADDPARPAPTPVVAGNRRQRLNDSPQPSAQPDIDRRSHGFGAGGGGSAADAGGLIDDDLTRESGLQAQGPVGAGASVDHLGEGERAASARIDSDLRDEDAGDFEQPAQPGALAPRDALGDGAQVEGVGAATGGDRLRGAARPTGDVADTSAAADLNDARASGRAASRSRGDDLGAAPATPSDALEDTRLPTGLALDLDERMVVRVVDPDNRPVAGLPLTFSVHAQPVFSGRTHSDGRFIFHPRTVMGVGSAPTIDLTLQRGDQRQTHSLTRGEHERWTLQVSEALTTRGPQPEVVAEAEPSHEPARRGEATSPPPADLVFIVDVADPVQRQAIVARLSTLALVLGAAPGGAGLRVGLTTPGVPDAEPALSLLLDAEGRDSVGRFGTRSLNALEPTAPVEPAERQTPRQAAQQDAERLILLAAAGDADPLTPSLTAMPWRDDESARLVFLISDGGLAREPQGVLRGALQRMARLGVRIFPVVLPAVDAAARRTLDQFARYTLGRVLDPTTRLAEPEESATVALGAGEGGQRVLPGLEAVIGDALEEALDPLRR